MAVCMVSLQLPISVIGGTTLHTTISDARDFSPFRKVVAVSLPRDITLVTPVKSLPPVSRKLSLPSFQPATTSITPSCSEPPTIVYSTTAVTDNHINIESPHSTSSIVADPTNPTPPEKTDVAIQCDIIDFQQFPEFQKFQEFQEFQKFQEFQEFQKFIEKKNSFKRVAEILQVSLM
jgi:hypothetical protein